MNKRHFLAPLAISIAALSGAASPDLSANTNTPDEIGDASTTTPSSTSADGFGIDLVLHRSDSSGIQVADYGYHYSHESHYSHGSHTSHTSSSY